MKRVILPVLILAFISALSAQSNDQTASKNLPKLSAEELVSKHVASIGTPEQHAAVKSRVMAGTGAFTSKTRPGKIGGPAQLASSGDMFLLAVVLNSSDYPFEKIGYDGKDFTSGVLPAGGSSPLGVFLKNNKVILRRGLLGGVLSQAWPLTRASKDVTLDSGGTVRIGDRTLYKLKVAGSGLGDMSVSLYFEPETFRHVRTEYFYRIGQMTSPNPDRPPTTGTTAPSTHTLTEDFSNFAKVEGMVLPLTYVIEYTTDAGKPLVWTMNFSQAYVNEPLEAAVFKIS